MSEVRLIDANALLKDVETMSLGRVTAKLMVLSAPTITPESLGYKKEAYGRWNPNMEVINESIYREQECSVCEKRFEGPDKPPYCPNCGTRMDGELW